MKKKTVLALALVVTAAIAAEFGFQANIYSWQDPGFTWTNYMFLNYWQSYVKLDYVPVPPMVPGDSIRITYFDRVVVFKLSSQDVYCFPKDAASPPGCIWLGVRPLEQPMQVLSVNETYRYYVPSGGYFTYTPNPEGSGYVIPGDPVIVRPYDR